MLAVEEVAEQQLVLVEAAVGDDEGERPLYVVLQREGLQTRESGHGLRADDGRGWSGTGAHTLRLYGSDVKQLCDKVKGHQAGTKVVLVGVRVCQTGM